MQKPNAPIYRNPQESLVKHRVKHRVFNRILVSILCLFAMFFSGGSIESTHSLAHLLLSDVCTQNLAPNEQGSSIVEVSSKTGFCSIQVALTQSLSNLSLLKSKSMLPRAQLCGGNSFDKTHDSLSPIRLVHWNSSRGPPAQV